MCVCVCVCVCVYGLCSCTCVSPVRCRRLLLLLILVPPPPRPPRLLGSAVLWNRLIPFCWQFCGRPPPLCETAWAPLLRRGGPPFYVRGCSFPGFYTGASSSEPVQLWACLLSCLVVLLSLDSFRCCRRAVGRNGFDDAIGVAASGRAKTWEGFVRRGWVEAPEKSHVRKP